jgi:5-(carboxyamino)imidazole ribonucleotide mutase
MATKSTKSTKSAKSVNASKALLSKPAKVKKLGASPLVIVLLGSGSDRAHGDTIANAARSFGIEVDLRIGSAHKTPQHVLALIEHYESMKNPKVWITVAGRSNALSAFVDAAVVSPVIACPPPSDSFGGADVYSSLRLPSGVASSVVLDPGNAALAAAKILGLSSPDVAKAVLKAQRGGRSAVLAADAKALMEPTS